MVGAAEINVAGLGAVVDDEETIVTIPVDVGTKADDFRTIMIGFDDSNKGEPEGIAFRPELPVLTTLSTFSTLG